MKKDLILLFGLIVCFKALAIGQGFNLHINVTGLHSNKGQVILYLYNSETGFPKDHKKAYKMAVSRIQNNTCILDLDNIPSGTYAVAFFHDENNNGIIDTNFLGLPTEGVGSSDNGTSSFGPPKFSGSKFDVKSNLSMILKTKYFFSR